MADTKTVSLALLAALALPAVAADLPAGVVAVPLVRAQALDAYYAEFQVGTPPQKEYLKVDTGSPFYSFLDPRNPMCTQASQPCSTYGTFNNLTSSTCHYEGAYFADGLAQRGYGDFLNDTLILGGVTMPNMYFGYTSGYSTMSYVSNPTATILGLTLNCAVTGPQCTWAGPYLLPQMKNASVIDIMAASFYLGLDDANATNAMMLLGGAYDKAKVDGDLFTLNMVDPQSIYLTDSQTNYVNVTAMEVVLDGGNRTSQTYGDEGVGIPILLDTGTASWYMSDSIFQAVYQGLGGQGSGDNLNRVQVIDCLYRDPSHSKSYISVEFGTTGKVQIPLSSLVSKFADGTCGSFITPRGDSASTMGDTFLRGVYTIFDEENWTVTMGNVRHTAEQQIVPFPKGGFKAKA
ncbi:hypothetical protein ACJQWK_01009 [Exserohilum turcicum]|uniref:Peptidase A1 domain-containing protein n=1 Tax=Exserohilum turcicum (strain 28A) TaxID=671987 RepID=R0IHE1_EXST2|nr:uncharacterized protein SETTUDRAFT_33386 [Exserohilum turcica Et28A]EOA84401.1 hypothetical protein SETTUDRAFT_33386 [Exserohilum turcica Et28A]